MATIRDYLQLTRVHQWYKNLIIFLPLVYSSLIFDFKPLLLIITGFFSLSFLSSANYILNDFIDKKRDQTHPEKKNRPLAAGRISSFTAILFFIILFSTALTIAATLSPIFLLFHILFFLTTLFYSLGLKNILFVDIILVATNFVIRAVSGAFLVQRNVSAWLILCPFFLAIFLIVGKRKADRTLLGSNAYHHKKVLRYYTDELNNTLMIVSTSLLLTTYTLFGFLSEHKLLLITLPFALYLIFRYLYLIYTHSPIARSPDLVYTDKGIVIGSSILAVLTVIILYL